MDDILLADEICDAGIPVANLSSVASFVRSLPQPQNSTGRENRTAAVWGVRREKGAAALLGGERSAPRSRGSARSRRPSAGRPAQIYEGCAAIATRLALLYIGNR